MKRNLVNLLLISVVALPLVGCVGKIVPKTTISGTVNGQPFTLSSPKDSKLKGLKITSQTGGLTNFTQIEIQEVEANMNPQVITTTVDGQVRLIQAVGSELRQTAASGAAAATGVPVGK